jgi:hypothetical protein
MACLLTKGRSLPCKTGVGGLKSVYFTDYGGLGTITTASNEITAISGTPTVYQFDIKGNSTLETTVNSSRENGTTFYESTLTLNFTFLEKETQAEIALLAVARPHIWVEDYNGNYFLVGKDHGAELTSGTFSSGAAMGDLSGYSLTFVAQETEAPDFTASSVVTGANQGTQIVPN